LAAYLFWGGRAVPANTPRAIVDRLHSETRKALEVPAVHTRLETLGVQAMPLSVDEFGKFAREDVAATMNLAREINLAPTN
jgi:tripartite-type tricarboxylate transporter receptor subunit TctC